MSRVGILALMLGSYVHADRLVDIAVQDARIWTQNRGAPPTAVQVPPPSPQVFDNWSQTLPYSHRVANADTLALHYVAVEWLGPSGAGGPPLRDGPDRRLIREGATTRVYQITLAPGQAAEPHTHATPRLTVLGTAGALLEDGHPEAKGGSGAGSWSWHGGQYRHVLRNEGPTRMVLYEIDWR
jgi:hypothetical protein